MRKTIVFLISLMFLLLAVSCGNSGSPAPVEPPVTDITMDADNLSGTDISIAGSQKVIIENLDEGEFVVMVPVSSQKSVGGKLVKDEESTPVLKTDLKTYVPLRGENGEVKFYGSDLEIGSSSNALFRPIKMAAGDAILDLNANPAPVPTLKIGDKSEYYEKFIEYDLTGASGDITDPTRVVLINMGSGGTGKYVYASGDFGILNLSDWKNRKESVSKIIDLSDRGDKLYLYLGLKIEAQDGHTISEYKEKYSGKLLRDELVFVTPYRLEEDTTTNPKELNKKVFSPIIDSTEAKYCLVIDSKKVSPEDKLNDVIRIVNDADPLFGKTGSFRDNFIPYSFDDDNGTYVYLGKLNDEFYFKFNPSEHNADLTLISLPDGHSAMINSLKESEIPTSEDTVFFIPLLNTFRCVGFRITDFKAKNENKKFYVKFYTDNTFETQVPKDAAYAKQLGLFVKSTDAYGYGIDFLYASDDVDYITVRKGSVIKEGFFANTSENSVYIKIWVEE